MRGASVLDLGAGTGLLGLCCACFGASVMLSDFAPPVLALLHTNATANEARLAAAGGTLRIAQYDWRQPFPLGPTAISALGRGRPAFDFIVATE